ncbi:MAG TPA: type II toxin-antitoxin system VapC family toxin [Gaiellaceae bacterium]|nr:type II toxin-antitoxin system VapC family toxin [Gaiellaceae bacterium]
MTVYADASAILKLYLDEPDSDTARGTLRADPRWISACITVVEVRRNLARLLDGVELTQAYTEFRRDWSEVASLAIDDVTSERAAALAEATGVRTLDALHLEAAERAAADERVPIVTFDLRLAEAARSLGWTVLGV